MSTPSPALPEARLAQGIRWFVHALFYVVSLVVGALIWAEQPPNAGAALGVLGALIAVYSLGARFSIGWRTAPDAHRAGPIPRRALLHVAATFVLWAVLSVLAPQGMWIAFSLFFVVLAAFPWRWGVPLLALTTAAAIGIGALPDLLDRTLGPGRVVGPLLGALVALGVFSVVRMLQQQIHVREQITQDLVSTRQQLADSERTAGVLEERERIARELHDTVAQSTISLSMLLEGVERAHREQDADRLERLLADAQEVTRRTTRQTRSFVDGDTRRIDTALSPAQALSAALTDLVESHQATTPARIELRIDEIGELTQASAHALERIASSLLANAVQHASAERIVLTLDRNGEEVLLDVVDDGAGFADDHEPGFGLRTIRARIESLGGSWSVESALGQGTAVQVKIPA